MNQVVIIKKEEKEGLQILLLCRQLRCLGLTVKMAFIWADGKPIKVVRNYPKIFLEMHVSIQFT